MGHFYGVPDNDLGGIGDALVARSDEVSHTPPRPFAAAAWAELPARTAEAAAALRTWEAGAGKANKARSKRTGRIDRSGELEAVADNLVAGFSPMLEGLATFGVPGAADMRVALYPEGVNAIVKKTGRPQRAVYDLYTQTALACVRDEPALHAAVAPYLDATLAAIADYAAAMDEKEGRSVVAEGDAAKARELVAACHVALDALYDTFAFAYGDTSDAFVRWIEPLTQWRAAQGRAKSTDDAASADTASTSTTAATASNTSTAEAAEASTEPDADADAAEAAASA